ncbi:hypothetical protein EN858_15005 [Mesorhizobium sp. M4B.F.Ca.ET.215.01.1.1]|uniref:hypothetical protein n=1 Tax=unclassified Mesorhizobium TaxID=325217 RepID=UPI001093E8AF|nr:MULTISPECIES: hypothetical protein [unclassified Mesorhizobium]TGQ11228.1 hypothetical protein EN858_15005 [Mesorhizobium sp. M4B.F.Ca.ET.215.01.1.1]TGR04719.1 hypothetical protein EN846_13075 [Mesorhizobium sp. M4B.F.Ca.ET.203.01.1.1]
MLTIHHADPYSVAVALNVVIDWPAIAYVGIDDDALVGSGGLAWGNDRCWVWFSILEPKPQYALPVLCMMRKFKKKAAQLGERYVYAIRDPQYETSPKLMKLAGFEFFAIEDGQEIFRCEIG